MLIGGRSCSLLCRPVELNAHGPRHTVSDVDSCAQDASTVVGHEATQKVEKSSDIERVRLMLHEAPPSASVDLLPNQPQPTISGIGEEAEAACGWASRLSHGQDGLYAAQHAPRGLA